jgi:hypothetical protein
MHREQLAPVTSLALAATLAIGAALVAPDAHAASDHSRKPGYTFAVIGDVPYGEPAQAHFPAFINGINADPDVALVTHLGDIKSGSTTCDDQRFAIIRSDFDGFEDPLVYTPGDNEWTDCHRANNGGYQPLERLDKVRSLFFSRPGTTLGAPARVTSQAARGIPENVRFTRGGLSFATLHVVGSNNDLAPWFTNTGPTPAQVAEEQHRMDVTIDNVRAAFRTAREQRLPGVVLMQQADMFDGTVPAPRIADYSAFAPLVQAIIDESQRFKGAVYLFNGDSHRFTQDRPLAAGSKWLSFYGAEGSADNLRRVTVDGSDLGEADWLKVTVHRHGRELLDVAQVPAS